MLKMNATHLQLHLITNLSYHELLAFGFELKKLTTKYQKKLIINDNVALTIELDADGVHLGQTDGNINLARKQLGNSKIIGLSIESDEQLILANQSNNLDYVAASAVFTSKSKTNLQKIWGIEGLTKFCKISKHPVIAIGGIDINNILEVVQTGVNGVAIINAIHESSKPKIYIQKLLS
jgi:thiamine-phosphate pyrophosphorylase